MNHIISISQARDENLKAIALIFVKGDLSYTRVQTSEIIETRSQNHHAPRGLCMADRAILQFQSCRLTAPLGTAVPQRPHAIPTPKRARLNLRDAAAAG